MGRSIRRILLASFLIAIISIIPCASSAVDTPVQKSQSIFYPQDKIKQFIKAAKQNSIYASAREAAIAAAKPYLDKSYDELWDMIIPPTLTPRSLMVWSNGYCPVCKKQVPMYSWKYSSTNRWQFSCPYCGAVFPTNDFEAYYRSGIDPKTGVYNPKLADKSLLYNKDHPDPSDPLHTFGVDDGTGMQNLWYFIGRAQYSNWQQNVMPAVSFLAKAYTVTNNEEYARRAAILLDRIADFFPEYDYMEQGLNYETHQTPGYVTYSIDSAYDVRNMVLAYDMIFDGIKNDSKLISFLSKKPGNNKMTTFSDIQENIEKRIFIDALKNPQKIFTNFPNTDITTILMNIVLDWPNNRNKIMEAVKEIAKKSTQIDGTTGEKGLSSYTVNSIRNLTLFFAQISSIDNNFLKDLLKSVPTVNDAYQIYFELNAQGYYPNVGDALFVGVKTTGYPPATLTQNNDPSLYTYFYQLYKVTGNVNYLKLMYRENGSSVTGIPYDPYRSDSTQIQAEIQKAITEYGSEYKTGSVNLKQYRLAMLRAGKSENEPALWITYDSDQRTHMHQDLLNLGLYYKNLDLMPDLGYPPVNMGTGWNNEYVAWYQSLLSHNTVICNDQLPLVYYENGVSELWVPGSRVQAITVGTSENERKDKMEGAVRTEIMVDSGKEDAYIIDVVRASRMDINSYSLFLSAGWGSMSTQGIKAKAKDNPFVGAEVKDLKYDSAPEYGWSVDFKRDDLFKYNNPVKDIHLKYTCLTKGAGVWTMKAWTEDNFNDGNIHWMPRIAVDIQTKNDEAATFVGVIEPYENASNIASVKLLPVYAQDGTLLSEDYTAIEVMLKNGEKDLILLNDNGSLKKPSNGKNIPGNCIVCVKEWNVETDARMLVLQKTKANTNLTASRCSVLKINNTKIGSPKDKSAEYFEKEHIKAHSGWIVYIFGIGILAVLAAGLFYIYKLLKKRGK